MTKRKYKKSIKTILFLLVIILILTIISLYLLNEYNKKIKIEKLSDNIYYYHIDKKEDEYIPVEIKDNKIYYLIKKGDSILLYNRDIHSKNDKQIGEIKEKYDYCLFENNYIMCSKDNSDNDYYNYDLKKIYTKKFEDSEFSTILYDNKILEIKDNKIYENEKIYKEITLTNSNLYYNDYIVINDNTYLVFRSSPDESYYYYDIKNNKLVKNDEILWSKYNKGYYSVNHEDIVIYDVENNKVDKFKNNLFNENINSYLLDNYMIYFVANKKLHILDLKNNRIEVLNYKFDKEINRIIYDNGLIYITSNIEDNEIYIIDNVNTKKDSYTIDEYKTYMNELVDKKVKEIEDNNKIDIVYKDEVKIDNYTFKAKTINDNFIILDALDTLNEVANKFNKEFFLKFHDSDHKGLIIYLTGPLVPNENANTTSNPAGYTLSENDEYEIAIDIEYTSSLKSNLCHEIMHNIENRIEDSFYEEWYKYNPKGFNYEYSYRSEGNEKYTLGEEDINKVYFIDSYAKLYPTEDIARTFEYICGVEQDSKLLEYPHLYEKGLYLKDKILKEFPSLENATVFNSLNKESQN